MSFHFATAFVLEIVTLVIYSKLQRSRIQRCCPSVTAVQHQIPIVNEDGTYQNTNQIPHGQLVYLVNENKPVIISPPPVPSFSNPSFQETNDSIDEV